MKVNINENLVAILNTGIYLLSIHSKMTDSRIDCKSMHDKF